MATRCNGPVWREHTQYQQTYALDHLHPIIEQHAFPPRPAPAGRPAVPGVQFPVRVHYSHHCFTIALEAAGHNRIEEIYEDLGRHEERIFNIRRWELSKQLPGVVKKLLSKELRCYQTRHANYIIADLGVAAPDVYRIYFSTSKWTTGVALFIESAYPTQDNPLGIGSGHKHKSINAVLADAL